MTTPHPGRSLRVFAIDGTGAAAPTEIASSTFQALKLREVQDLERWLKQQPDLMGEPLKIVSSQFAGFDGTLDRLDLLALDKQARLVVVEIKRDAGSSGAQELQALRYAAYVSAIDSEQLVELYQQYEQREHGRTLSPADARHELEEFVETEDGIARIDDDPKPRALLVASGFAVGTTSTVLWLTTNFDLDITCVQVTPYEVEGQLLLASSVLLPLPEAKDYEVRLREKRRRSAERRRSGGRLDFAKARAFIESIPQGKWSSYGDVAAAAGAPSGAQAVGGWLLREADTVPVEVYRVLKRKGVVSPGWNPERDDLPPTAADVIARLRKDGVRFDDQERASQDDRWSPEDWLGADADDG